MNMKITVYKYIFQLFILLFVIVNESWKPAEIMNYAIDIHIIQDGIYTGYFKKQNKASAKVEIGNKRIVSLTLEKFEATPFGRKAKDPIPQRIFQLQYHIITSL
jgi:uncharacterized protein with FMN-binding domain